MEIVHLGAVCYEDCGIGCRSGCAVGVEILEEGEGHVVSCCEDYVFKVWKDGTVFEGGGEEWWGGSAAAA